MRRTRERDRNLWRANNPAAMMAARSRVGDGVAVGIRARLHYEPNALKETYA